MDQKNNSNQNKLFTCSTELAKQVRLLSLKLVKKANSSHIGSALSITDIISVLYLNILNVSPKLAKDANRDIFILSKGHACVSVYSLLGLLDFFNLSDLNKYGDDDSIFMTHISHKVNGVEFSTGSLGHGLPFAVGKALASKISKINNKIYVLVGDGELDEGSNWEALLFAGHHKLHNLIIIVDNNNLQSLTTVDKTLGLEPLRQKFESFGCEVFNVNGHDHKNLKQVFEKSKNDKFKKPKVIIAKTVKGKGISYMENQVKWHYSSPNESEYEIALNELLDA